MSNKIIGIDEKSLVCVIVEDEAGRWFLIQRDFSDSFGGRWALPGGSQNSGEKPLDCGKRELLEETGMQASSWKSIGRRIDNKGNKCFIYKSLATGMPSLGEDVVGCGWFTRTQIKSLNPIEPLGSLLDELNIGEEN